MGKPDPAVIRRATPRDAMVLSNLENRTFSGDRISLRSFRRLLRRESAAVLVAEHGDQPAGYAMVLFRRNSRAARLYSIAIDSRHAGRGLGRALLAASEKYAARCGAKAMRLEVREDNTAAIALYRSAGYQPTGHVAGYYADGCDALCFAKPLSVTAAPEVKA